MTNHYGYKSDSELYDKTSNQGVIWSNTRPFVSGFLETKNFYDNGTAETRSILVRECSLIYECNVCRNLFRCLTNFIKHKRLYCCTSFDHMSCIKGDGYQDDITDKKANEKQGMADGGIDNLSYLILKMLAGENKNKLINPEGASNADGKRRSEVHTKDSSQKWKCRNRPIRNRSSFTTEDTELRDAGVEVTSLKPTSIKKTSESPTDLKNICDLCERNFETKKSLNMHYLKKHKLQKFRYQCPSCSLTFLKPAAVVQHLSSEHKKSIRCINLMRHTIQKRRVLQDETFMRTAPVQHDEKDVGSKQESITDNASSCAYCQKPFQRKAVLLTHQNSCRSRNTYSSGNNLFDQTENIESSPGEQKLFAMPSGVSLNDSNKSSTDQSNVSIQSSEDFKSDSTQASPLKRSNNGQETLNSQGNDQSPKSKYMPCLCKICNKHFSALSNLRRHISMIHYRTRKFACKLCDYRAFRKYDVINHLGHIHKILGDKEMLSLEYIEEHAETSFREAFDEDIILVTDDQKAKSMENLHTSSSNIETNIENVLQSVSKYEESSNITKNKYLKPYFKSSHMQKSTTRKRQKLKRSVSQQFEATLDPRHKRPKRNRITPVEKDFVYDLSTILKNEDNEKDRESGRSLKRRDTVLLSSTTEIKLEETGLYRPLINYSADIIKGSAQKTAVLSVHQGRAAYSSLPQLPSQRPLVRMRHATIQRSDFITAPAAIEAINLKEERLQTKQLEDDSFFKNLSKTASVDFKMKPRLTLPQSTINSLLKKVDQTLQNRSEIKSEEREIIVESVPKINVKQEISIEDIDEKYLHAQSFEVKPAYSKYVNINQNQSFEIMQCLVENTPQNSESLLRLALEN